MTNWSDYAHTNDGGGMIILLLILGAILIYLLFSKGFWLDKYMRDSNNWRGEDIHPDYQENIPFTPSLEKPFDDPEVPNRPSKTKKKKVVKKPKKKRIYKRRKKK